MSGSGSLIIKKRKEREKKKMKQKKIPYDKAELEIIFFYAEDIVTTSNMEGGGESGWDQNDPADKDEW